MINYFTTANIRLKKRWRCAFERVYSNFYLKDVLQVAHRNA